MNEDGKNYRNKGLRERKGRENKGTVEEIRKGEANYVREVGNEK